MKLDYLELSGFRGFRDSLRIEFAERFTIIDGRNGVGKSTVFDAVEFALTGQLTKYEEAKASGESASDYIWWRGAGTAASDRYVEVGLRNGEERVAIRRKQIGQPEPEMLRRLEDALCDPLLSPKGAVSQLCSAAIIRDEHITKLSLDLKEADRYALLRNALGANDTSDWANRAGDLVSAAKKRTSIAQQDVASANAELAAASRRLDEVRASLSSDRSIADAALRLQEYLGAKLAPDQLSSPARLKVAEQLSEIQRLQAFATQLAQLRSAEQGLPSLEENLALWDRIGAEARAAYELVAGANEEESQTDAADTARDLISLLSLGKNLGLRDGRCPLCSTPQSSDAFGDALQHLEALALRLDSHAAATAERKKAREHGSTRLAAAEGGIKEAQIALASARALVESGRAKAAALGLKDGGEDSAIADRILKARAQVAESERDIRVLETLRLNDALERAQRSEADAKARVAKAQDRFGRSRRADASAQAIHDASRRAASETLDRRLERVLPLMSELYRRLRPHPLWNDIEYSIRGDVRRFLRLQVGGDLNPQFLFSSGQRRATGLAFLLSVNLSLAWSRWRTILLDDPVQHVDDFRSVHLAELLAQMVAGGRQVVCSVEDVALADMLARRLPVEDQRLAKRVTLGPDSQGKPGIQDDRFLIPHVKRAFGSESQSSAQAA